MPKKSNSQEMTPEERAILLIVILIVAAAVIYSFIQPYLLVIGIVLLVILVGGTYILWKRFGTEGLTKIVVDTILRQRKKADSYIRKQPSPSEKPRPIKQEPTVNPTSTHNSSSTPKESQPTLIARIPVRDDATVTYPPTLEGVLDAIRQFVPRKRYGFGAEQRYKDELVGYLNKEFGNRLRTEQGAGSGQIDITIGNNEIGIEVKSTSRKSDLDRLYGQGATYAKYFQHLIILIFDEGINHQDLEEFEYKVKNQDILLREKAVIIVK